MNAHRLISTWRMLAAACLAVGAATPVQSQNQAAPSPWNEIPLSEGTFREHGIPYRSDVIDIPLAPQEELEYKLEIREGNAIVYRWEVLEIEDPALLYAEFHGHTERVGDAQGDLMFYRKAEGGTESGSLIAPFTGIHGWYLVNSSADPITVRLEVAGFYELLGL